ncbi:uncharacterized protein HD556DRAFT_1238088 [Suillus plorans]|uniref:Uncharacterized protein n=1 Tax=Suillus plorans TaxID=116603 RepID=A0A9P7DH53_9AGAM|nr:uncharacterized protein HD556DRAFT_1238088 [Suillus plorans]KAG1793283.1 hypothetical protein HD556DRAFT_1238088 [Suillus plorans]
MQLESPDEDLPAIQVSLNEFVSAAEQMFIPDQLDNFLRFVLAGRLQYHNKLARIFINARQGASAPPMSQYQLYRDIDSVIGITRDLPFQLPLAIFPLASFRDALTEDNHLKCPLSCPKVCGFSSYVQYFDKHTFKDVIGIPLHRIPNMALGKADRRHITRIFFPQLYRQGQSPAIPPETMTVIYEKCLRPAVVGLNPVDRSRWPITYSTAMNLYRDQKGKFHFGTVDFPSNLLDKLGPKLLEMFQMQDGLHGTFFVHELRGTKGASHHDPSNAGARHAALNAVFHLFDMSLVRPEDWVVDIGLEIQHEGHIDIFHSLDLHCIFSQIQYRIIDDADWHNLVFERYFPPKGGPVANALQHFPSASYYRQWQTLMDGLDKDHAEIIQNHHLQWFHQLYWVPHPESDRMWSTRKGGKGWIMLPPGEPRHCPRIAINPRFIGKDMTVALVVGTP